MRSLCAALATVAVAGLVLAGPGASADPAPVASSGASTYTPVAPVRMLDTRTGSAVGAGGVVSVDLSSRVPADATAVVFNLTGVQPTASTFVTAFPHGQSRPVVSNLNLRAGEIRANLVTVAVGADRVVDLYNNSGSTHLLADLAGYYTTGNAAKFVPVDARNVLYPVQVGAQSTTVLDLTWRVPASASAVTLNITGNKATSSTYVTAWPSGSPRPTASSVNVAQGAATTGTTTVAIGADRKVDLYNHNGSLELTVDIAGFYTPAFGAVFTPVNPVRVFDTRDGTGTTQAGPIADNQSVPVQPGQLVPDDAVGAVVNLTGIAPTSAGYLTVRQSFGQPTTRNLSLGAGQISANLAAIPLRGENPGARAQVYNGTAGTHAAVDLAGYFRFDSTTCASGCAYSWGPNLGHLGIGTTTTKSVPVPLAGLPDVVSVSTHFAAREDGTVWGWGSNVNQALGGDWLGGSVPTPIRVGTLNDVVAVAETTDTYLGPTGLALRSGGGVVAWGVNGHGTLGPGSDGANTGGPVPIGDIGGATAIAGGEGAAYALRPDGTVMAWGWNDQGQLGAGYTMEDTEIPVQVAGLTGVTAIAAGGKNAYALTSDGSVSAWGSNTDGKLGNGTTAALSRVPVRVSGLTDVVAIAADATNAYAVKADGTVWAWGPSGRGALGNGVDCQNCASNVPVRVVDLTGATDVVGHDNGGHVLTADGQVWGWGENAGGQLGADVSEPYRTRPVRIAGLTGVTELGAGGRALVS